MSANDEKLRLDASLFNNLAVGSYIAGAVAPAVPLYEHWPFLDVLFRQGQMPPLPSNFLTAVFLSLWCIMMAIVFRHLAHKMIDRAN